MSEPTTAGVKRLFKGLLGVYWGGGGGKLPALHKKGRSLQNQTIKPRKFSIVKCPVIFNVINVLWVLKCTIE